MARTPRLAARREAVQRGIESDALRPAWAQTVTIGRARASLELVR
jgi:hypothetical protein